MRRPRLERSASGQFGDTRISPYGSLIVVKSQADLFEVIRTLRSCRCLADFLPRWPQWPDHNSNNRYLHKKFNLE